MLLSCRFGHQVRLSADAARRRRRCRCGARLRPELLFQGAQALRAPVSQARFERGPSFESYLREAREWMERDE